MKHVLLFIIRMYWFIIPANKRKHCLFKESCSDYVFRNTKKLGLIEGLKALKQRVKSCQSGYYMIEIKGKKGIIAKDNKFYEESTLRQNIL